MKKETKPKFSSYISDFCKMITNAKQDYEWNCQEMGRLEKQTQDYLHALELEDLDYRGRARIATQLAMCRKLRRASKDTTELLRPLIEFINSDKGKQTMNLMKEILGRTRKVEDYMQTRTYRYKIVDEDQIKGKGNHDDGDGLQDENLS